MTLDGPVPQGALVSTERWLAGWCAPRTGPPSCALVSVLVTDRDVLSVVFSPYRLLHDMRTREYAAHEGCTWDGHGA